MTEADPVPETPAALQAIFASVLRPGEKLLWAGLPLRGIKLTWSDIPRLFIGLFLLGAGASVAGETIGATPGGAPPDLMVLLIRPLMTGIFVMAGLYCLVGRIGWDAYLRRRSFYAVTSERALIWYRGRRDRITEIPLATLDALTLMERPNDRGTIILGRDRKVSVGWPKYLTIRAPRFELADNVLWVYRLAEAVRHRTYWLPH